MGSSFVDILPVTNTQNHYIIIHEIEDNPVITDPKPVRPAWSRSTYEHASWDHSDILEESCLSFVSYHRRAS
jgi:hypothetical protein